MSSDAERYERLHALFDEARRVATEHLGAWLRDRCGSEPDLREELEALLAPHEDQADDPLSESRISAGREALEQLLPTLGSPAVDTQVRTPEHIGHYRILGRIAEGGMGVVYEAEQASPRRRIALKVIHPLFVTDTRLKRFRQEAELLGRLQHPGIAQIHEAGTYDLGHGSQPFIAMEFVDGVSITSYAQSLPLPLRKRVQLLAEACDAIDPAHEMGVIHRDLKPDNILVDPHGQPKVLDFGIARASEGSTVLTTLVTEEGDLLGTIASMAPEQLDGVPESITPRSDVYALGVLAFELLAGRPAHDLVGLPLAAAIQIVREKEPPRLGELRPELKGDLETIVGKALEKESERRYASAGDLAGDLRAYLESRPIAARPPSRIYRVRKFTRRNRALVWGTAATFVAILVGLVVSLVFAARARTGERLAREGQRRAVAGVLQATQDLLERGELWRAALGYRQVADAPGGWAKQFLQQVLPRLLPERVGNGRVVWIDDRTLAAPNPDAGGIDVLDAETFEVTRRLLAGWKVRSLMSTPLGLEVLIGRPWTDALLVDADTGRILHRFSTPEPPKDDHVPSFVPDPEGGFRDYLVGPEVVRRFVEGAEVGRVELGQATPFSGVHLSPYARRLVTVDAIRGVLRTLDTDTGRLLGTLGDLRQSTCNRCWFDPDGRHAVTPDADRRLVVVDIEQASRVRRIDGPVCDTCEFGDFSVDGSIFAHGPWDRPVEVWNLATGELLFSQEVRMLPKGGCRVRLSPSVDRLLASSDSAGFCLLDLKESLVAPEGLATESDPRDTIHRGHGSYVYDLAVAADGRLIASASPAEAHVRLWDASSGETIALLEKPGATDASPNNRGRLIAFSTDGRRLLCTAREAGRSDPELLHWDLLTGERRVESLPEGTEVDSNLIWLDRCLELLGPGPQARLGRKVVRLRDGTAVAVQEPQHLIPDGTRWRTFVSSNAEEALTLSPDSERVAVGTIRTVSVFDRARAEVQRTFLGQAYAVDWSPDGRVLAAGGDDGRIRLYDAELLIPLLSFPAHDDYIFSLVWSPDGTRLVSASGDTTVRVWDARGKREKAADRAGFEARLDRARTVATDALSSAFDRAESVEERGALVRVALERRR